MMMMMMMILLLSDLFNIILCYLISKLYFAHKLPLMVLWLIPNCFVSYMKHLQMQLPSGMTEVLYLYNYSGN